MSRIENGFSLYGDSSAFLLPRPLLFCLRCELPGDLAQLTSFFLEGVEEPRPLPCFKLTRVGVGLFPALFDARMLDDELLNWLELFRSEGVRSSALLRGEVAVFPG